MTPLRVSFYLLLLAACPGCLIVPTPHYDSDAIQTRRNVTPKTGDAITDGVTTREEVLLMLGEPDASLYGGRRFVYLWAKVVGLWFVAAGCEGDVGEIPRGYVLEIDFDVRSVARAHQTRTCRMQDLFKQRVLNGIPYPADRGPPRHLYP